ncbi:MAG TPA: carboxypeptidase regulatory-like domain-containing protein [Candidatus Eremiobacteraceae bacterium]|nr:carboxypeptidase regulatory-like domain-containing protein [Candidatus Eremiobacteraceae bacterium]
MTLRKALSVDLRWALLSLLAMIFAAGSPLSSAQSFRGAIRGDVTDASGYHVPAAKVVARNLGTSETREITAGDDGEYRFLELPAGEYEVSAVAGGFEEVRVPKVRVEVGVETLVNLVLSKVKSQSERVEVIESVPLMETSGTTLSQVVDHLLVQELPLNGRDFGKLVALTPGVTVEGSGVAGSEKGFGQFNIDGNRDRSNNYNLDGTDNNDPFFNNSALNQVGITGAPATLLPLDAIQEFNLQAQFGAEYGRNSGSVVNIITRSGSNDLHGSLYEFNRNSWFDARNYFNTKFQSDGSPNPQSPFNNNNFGGSLGGPILKDKIFFFFAYEGQRERVGSDFALSVPSQGQIAAAQAIAVNNPYSTVPSINPALIKITNLFPTSDSNSLAYSVRDTNNGDNLIGKVDYRINQNNSVSARYAFGQSTQAFPLGSLGGYGSGSRLANFEQISPTRVQVVSLNWLTTLSSTHINEVRFGYSRFRTSFNSADATPGNPNYIDPAALGLDMGTDHVGLPEIDFNGVVENLGATAYSVPRGRVSETFQILDNFTWIRGRHTYKFGGEYHRYDVQSFNDNLERGLLDVNTCVSLSDGSCPQLSADPIVNALANFYIGNIYAIGDAGNTQRFTFNNNLGFFGQDEIRLRPNLTITAGLRWEFFSPLSEKHDLLSNFDASKNLVQVGSPTLPILYHRDLNNFGPRLGISWSPFKNTVIRTAYGVYYDYTPQNNLIANYTNSAGVATNPVSSLANSPYFVGALNFNSGAWTATAPGPVFSPVPAGTPQSIFITDPNLRTPYVQSWNLNIQRELSNTLAFEIGYVGSKGTRLTRLYDANQGRDFNINNPAFPQYAAVDVFSDSANSTYNGLQTTVRMQQFHGFSGFSTYTFSKSLDGASDGINFNFANAAFPQDSTNLRAEKGPSTFDTRHRWTTALNYAVPYFHVLPHVVAAGWQLNSVVTVQSGRPINIITDEGGVNSNFVERPDILPGVNPILPHWTPTTGYLNPNAFSYPAMTAADPYGYFGDLGRDQIFGPGFWNYDFSATKNFHLREWLQLQFRAEFFNIFNHPNFALPSNVITPGFMPDHVTPNPNASTAGLITQTPDVAQGNPGLGGGGPRVMQFGLRLQF